MQGQRSAAVAVTASLVALLVAAPRPDAALRLLADAGSSTDPTGPLVAAVALAAWLVAGWLALTVTVVLLSRLPGLLGRTARAVAGRVAPLTVRRAVEAALGITVAVGVVAPTAAVAAPVPAATSASTSAAETAWDLDWPGRTPPPSAIPERTAAPGTAAVGPPASSPPAPPAPPPPPPPVARPPPARPTPASPIPVRTTPVRTSTPPAARPAPAAPPSAATRPSPVTAAAGALVVRSGDTLWSLAEASLRSAGTRPTDRQVAQAWPRWWAANREAVGDDPDLLLPGTVLRPPQDSPGSS